jgi:O-methyltransferase involved in polyketide biosynthesis
VTVAGRIPLRGAQLTLLSTLEARAADSRARRPILGDRTAAAALARLDYDLGGLRLGAAQRYWLVVRAKHIDDWTAAFVRAHPTGTVVHLGCGLDDRLGRVGPPPSVRWYDLDYPEVIALRRELYPPSEHARLLAASVTDLAWLTRVAAVGPVLVVGEGLFMYLREPDVARVLRHSTRRFGAGELIFDVYNRFGVRAARRSRYFRRAGARIAWGVDDPHAVEALVPGVRLAAVQRITDSPYLARVPAGWRLVIRAGHYLPALREGLRILRFTFR